MPVDTLDQQIDSVLKKPRQQAASPLDAEIDRILAQPRQKSTSVQLTPTPAAKLTPRPADKQNVYEHLSDEKAPWWGEAFRSMPYVQQHAYLYTNVPGYSNLAPEAQDYAFKNILGLEGRPQSGLAARPGFSKEDMEKLERDARVWHNYVSTSPMQRAAIPLGEMAEVALPEKTPFRETATGLAGAAGGFTTIPNALLMASMELGGALGAAVSTPIKAAILKLGGAGIGTYFFKQMIDSQIEIRNAIKESERRGDTESVNRLYGEAVGNAAMAVMLGKSAVSDLWGIKDVSPVWSQVREYKGVENEFQKASREMHKKDWQDLSPAERGLVIDRVSGSLKKPSQQVSIKNIILQSDIEAVKAAQQVRNRIKSGQPANIPPRLAGLSNEQIETLAGVADKSNPQGRFTGEDAETAAKRRAEEVSRETKRREAGGQGLRDLIAFNRQETLRKAVDKIIASAPEKRAAEAEPVVLEGRPQTADERFDQAIDAAKAEIGEKQVAEAKRLAAERERLLQSIRQGADRATKEEAERIAQAQEEKPKVADRRRLALEPLPYRTGEHREIPILEGRPMDADEAFTRRQEEVMADIKREQAARFAENERRLRDLAFNMRIDMRRAVEEYLERTENEAAARGFKIVDLRGAQRPETLSEIPILKKPTEGTTPVSGEPPAGKPAPLAPTPETTAAAPTTSEKAAPTYAIAPETRIEGVTGSPYTLHVEDQDIPVVAKIVSADKLKPSHDPGTFAVVKGGISDTERWGRKLQPRNYDTDSSAQLAVEQHANDFKPNMVTSPDPSTTTGPPVILPDGTVMGGNSRTMSMVRLYQKGEGEKVRNAILAALNSNKSYGLNPDSVPQVADKPVLVWELQNPPAKIQDLGILADNLNRPPTRSLSEIEEGIAVGQRVSDEALEWISDRLDEAGPDATMLDVIRNNDDHLASVMQREGWFSGTQRSRYINDETGKLTDAGRKLLVNAMFGKVFDDATMLKNAPPEVVDKLERSLPLLLRMKRRGDMWNLVPRLTEAVKLVTSAKSIPKSVHDYTHPELDKKASDRFPGMKPEFNPIVEALGKKLEASSGLHVKRSLAQYMTEAGLAAQPMLGAPEPPKPWDAFNEYVGKDAGVIVKATDWLDIDRPPVEAQNTVVEPPKAETPKVEEPPAPLKPAKKSTSRQEKALEPPPDEHADFRKEVQALPMNDLLNRLNRETLANNEESRARAKIVREEMDRREAGEPPAALAEPKVDVGRSANLKKAIETVKASYPELYRQATSINSDDAHGRGAVFDPATGIVHISPYGHPSLASSLADADPKLLADFLRHELQHAKEYNDFIAKSGMKKGSPESIKAWQDSYGDLPTSDYVKRGIEAGPRKAQGIATEEPPHIEPPPVEAQNKVVEKPKAKPIRAYHGTTKDFEAFDLTEAEKTSNTEDKGLGIFFSTNPKTAGKYAEGKGGNIRSVDVGIENPASAKDRSAAKLALMDKLGRVPTGAEERQYLIDKGFDGIKEENTVVAFHPEQVKPAYGGDPPTPLKARKPKKSISVLEPTPESTDDAAFRKEIAALGSPELVSRYNLLTLKNDPESRARAKIVADEMDRRETDPGRHPEPPSKAEPPKPLEAPKAVPEPPEKFASIEAAQEAHRKGTLKSFKIFSVGDNLEWLDEQGMPHRKFANMESAPKKGEPPSDLAIPGMKEAAEEAHETRGKIEGEQLTQAIKTPPTESISKAAGEMERKSPLFGGTEAVTGQKAMSWGAENSLITQDEAARAREAIRKKLLGGGLKAGVDPSVLVDMAKLGLFHFEAGTREFLKWSDRMTDDLGAWARPHLREVWTRMPVIAREEAQRKIKASTPPAEAAKIRARADMFAGIEKKPLGLVDVSGREATHGVYGGRTDVAPGREEPRRLDETPDEAARRQRPVGAKPDEEPGVAGRPGREPKPLGERPDEGKRAAGEKKKPEPKPLADIKPVDIEPVKPSERSPVIDEAKWRRDLYRYRMPDAMPPPTVSLNPTIDAKLYPQQSMLAARAVSTLMTEDAVILATPTGTGKTRYLGPAVMAEMLDRMGPNKETATVLILTPTKPLGRAWVEGMDNFGLKAERFPNKISAPEKPGIYTMTYAAAIRRTGIEKFKFDIVVADESQWARRWYAEKDIDPQKAQAAITQGQLTKEITNNARKVIYSSATPFHTALELGYMEKLGLWKAGEFEGWAKQFGITHDQNGWNVPPNPQRLTKLWFQMVEQGKLVGMDQNLEGQHVQFVVVPLPAEYRAKMQDVTKAFALAERFFDSKGLAGKKMAAKAHARLYMKAYLERTKLSAVAEMVKKFNDAGWKVGVASETRSPVGEIYDFLKLADAYYGGEISRLLPKLPGVAEKLEADLGGGLAKYMGPHSQVREEQLKKFQEDEIKNMYFTIAAGGMGVDMHDTVGDKPRVNMVIGPPWSGMALGQEMGRFSRYGSKSNVYHLFVTTNAEPEVSLLLGKVAPRLESMKAIVHGVASGDPVVGGFRNAAAALEYAAGMDDIPDLGRFSNVLDLKAVDNYKSLRVPDAKEAMNKPLSMERTEPPPEPRIVSGKEPPPPLAVPKSKSGLVKGALYSGIDPEVAKEVLKKTAQDVAGVAKKLSKAIGEELAGKIDYVSDDPAVTASMEEIRRMMKVPDTKKAFSETFPSLYDKDAFERATSIASEGAGLREPYNPEGAAVNAWRDSIEGISTAKEFLKTAFTKDEHMAPDVGIYAGMLRSGQHDIMALGGEPGKEIVNDIHDYWVRRGNYGGKMGQRALGILTESKIEKDEFPGLVRSIVYDEAPANERIAKARDQLRALFGDAIDQATASGVRTEIRDPNGRMRYETAKRDPHYWPREWDPEIFQKGKKAHENMVKRLMHDRGLTEYDARNYLAGIRRDIPLAGHLERPRRFDLPDFEMTPEVLFKYIDDWAEARARAEVFGQHREKLQSKVLDIKGDNAEETFKRQRAVNAIMDTLLERYHPSNAVRRIEALSSNWVAMAHMTRSMIPMLTHATKSSMNTSTRDFVAGIVDILRDLPGGMRLAMRSGAIETKWSPRGMRDIAGVGKPRDIFLRLYGVKFIDMGSRLFADSSARSWMNRTALPALLRDADNPLINRLLKEKFSITSDQVHAAVANKFWSDEALDRAGKRSADFTQGTGDPTELPPWASARSKDPFTDSLLAVWRTSWLLKKYSFRNGSFMAEQLIGEARKGNWRPWIPFLAIVVPTSFMVNSVTHAARGDIKYMLDDLKAITGQGDAETALHHAAHAIAFMATYNYFSGIVDGIMNYHSSLQQELAGLPVGDVSYGVEQVLQASKDIWEGDIDKGLKRLWNIPTSRITPLRPLRMPLPRERSRSLGITPAPYGLPKEYQNQAY